MKSRLVLLPLLLTLLVTWLMPYYAKAQKKADKKINVVVIYVDDLGWGELSSYGNKRIATPNIDALGKEGIRFTQAYASAPICAPSRAGLITGRYQQRFGFEYLAPVELPYSDDTLAVRKPSHPIPPSNFSLGSLKELNIDPESYVEIRKGIPETELTLAEVFKNAGYKTAAIGKWHLGEKNGFYPTQNGFDYFYGCLNWGTLYSNHNDTGIVSKARDFEKYIFPELRSGSYALFRNTDSVYETQYLTDKLADEAIAFMERSKADPFFLYLPFNAVHDPLQAKKADFDNITSVKDSSIRLQLALTKSLDDAVGRVIKKLKDLNLEDNTIVFFASDNGGPTYYHTVDNSPLKGGKLSHFEGGIRVPYFIKFPGKINAGKAYEYPVSNLDIFSTALAAANVKVPDNREIDGINLLPFLNGTDTKRPHEILYWRNGYSRAIRKGDWKLYVNERNGVSFLYDLSTDQSETTDLSRQYPEKVKELLKDFKNWEKKTIKPVWPNTRNVLLPVGNESFYFPI